MPQKTLNYIIFFIWIVSRIEAVYGQNPPLSQTNLEGTGVWNGVYLKGKITNKIGYYGEHHLRLRNNSNNLNSFLGPTKQIYNRAGISFFVSENFEIILGPTLVLNFSVDPDDSNLKRVVLEPRIWHQWLFKMPEMGRVSLFHQFRFEHRWKRSNEIDAQHNYTNRYRYKVFAYIPLNKDVIEPKTLFFSPSAEIFMQSGKSVVFNPFEDFRTYNGIGYVLNPNFTFFVGHMWTIGQKNSGFEFTSSHILRFNVFFGLDFRKIQDKLPSINLGY